MTEISVYCCYLCIKSRKASDHYHGDHHLGLSHLHLAIRCHLHDGSLETKEGNPSKGCHAHVPQQSHQPSTLHLHQQAGQEGPGEAVHLSEAEGQVRLPDIHPSFTYGLFQPGAMRELSVRY